MKKKLVLASSACLVASAMALGGCSGGSKPAETSAAAEKSEAAADATTAAAEGGSSDAMHLSFYYPVNVGGDAAKLIEKICADFNAENPDIVVDPVYTGNYDDTVTKIQTAIQGGTPPDVFVSLATQRFTMASTGMAMPLDDLIAADGDEGKAYIDDFLSGFMEDSYVDSREVQRYFSIIRMHSRKLALILRKHLQPGTNWLKTQNCSPTKTVTVLVSH